MSWFKLALAGLMVAVGVMLFPAIVSAAVDPFDAVCKNSGGSNVGSSSACSAQTTQNPLAGQDGVISRVISIMAIVVGIVSVIFIIWAGIKYITAGGDSSKISSAKATIIYALIGLVIALIARPLINFVIGRL